LARVLQVADRRLKMASLTWRLRASSASLGFALGDPLVVVGAAVAVPVADLADCGHVHGVIRTVADAAQD